jgi:NDP-sugar pyrophosphorylase family protein
MKAVILAGGLGTRLRPFTQIIPKPLLPVGESSVLEIQILSLRRAGFTDIYIATNYMADYVQAFLGDGSKYGVQLTFSREEKPLGTCGPLGLLRDDLTEPFILMNGDILTNLDFAKLREFAAEVDSDLTVVTRQMITPFNFGRVISDGDFLTEIQEKPDFRLEIVAGIYAMKPKILERIPPDEYFGMDKLIQGMLGGGIPVARYEMRDYWLDIGQIKDFEEAQDVYDEHFHHLRSESK